MDRDRAREQLEKGKEHLEAGHLRRAISALGKGIDALCDGKPDDAPSVSLLGALSDGLFEAAERSGKPSAWTERLPSLFANGLHAGRAAAALVRELAVEQKRADDDALDVYIAFLAAGGRVDEPVRIRLNQALSFGLHVRLSTPIEEAKAREDRLRLLHAARPKLTFPRLYLGRLRYLEREYEGARELLAGVSGRLAASPKVLNVRARCAEKLNETDEALELYQRSLEDDYHQPHVHFRIGRLLVERYRLTMGAKSPFSPTESQP
jgi:tetratricopeptide (TPR) repeat protein